MGGIKPVVTLSCDGLFKKMRVPLDFAEGDIKLVEVC